MERGTRIGGGTQNAAAKQTERKTANVIRTQPKMDAFDAPDCGIELTCTAAYALPL
jgi:hypothetical protein